ncbi:hypothetical protein [Streptomyces sp. NPDC093071]|uniref:hypothetical protein n=1 Tax=Streptomyces sp. NPDC093071 TaxID=3366022 RepID=UPI003824453C
MTDLFDVRWRQDSLPQESDETQETLDSLEHKAVQLMAIGLLDEAISRQGGLPVRTTRWIIGKPPRRLGASSGFRAGVSADRNGRIRA